MVAKCAPVQSPQPPSVLVPSEIDDASEFLLKLEAMLSQPSPKATAERGQLLPFRRKAAAAVDETKPTWHELLAAFGPAIAQLRQQQQLSLEQLHFKTQVPMYHLISLESSAVDKLPEEIFVRGFLRRICNQLGPAGQRLLEQLPPPAGVPQQILADWQRQNLAIDGLHPAHLYFGYATLVVGAVGGLAWSTAQANALPEIAPVPVVGDRASLGRAPRLNPAAQARSLSPGHNVAPPEPLAPEMN